ncbi:MAG TPA: aldolase/citrate lyase family protein, partial [Casimicrobiaceae bacterium]|nr:aldolase/citrate lyase family protein [Casimicrobiaceae bacterium]
PQARSLAHELYGAWRAQGFVAAVRVNPMAQDGLDDLAAVMRGAPDIVALPKVAEPADVVALDAAVTRFEREFGLPQGATKLLPNVEYARGLVQTFAIARASPRVVACLLASEDLAHDLGAERGRDGLELAYPRQRFLVECVAAGTLAVDCPYTWRDAGVVEDTRWARRLGYRAKSAVAPEHAAMINAVLTPDAADVDRARRIVAAFDDARSRGEAGVEVDGTLVEVPVYLNAKRLIARAAALAAAGHPAPAAPGSGDASADGP